MANKIGGVDIGNVLIPEPIIRRKNTESPVGGGLTYWQNLYSPSTQWRITGYLKAPTTTAVNQLLNLKHGLPVLVDLDDRWPGFITWGRVAEIRPRPSRVGNVFYYDMLVNEVPAIGVTYLQTSEAYLHDLDYHANHRVFNPLSGRFAKSVTLDLLDWSWQFYVDNDKISIQTLIQEFQVGDDIDKLKIWGWKLNGSHDWSLIGDWGGADAWDAEKTFTDDDAIAHVFRANYGDRGDVKAGIGTISQMLGLSRRVLLSITLMQAQSGNDYSTDHSSDQLLLKVTAEHNQREAARPYPVLTYVDGSLDYGRA